MATCILDQQAHRPVPDPRLYLLISPKTLIIRVHSAIPVQQKLIESAELGAASKYVYLTTRSLVLVIIKWISLGEI